MNMGLIVIHPVTVAVSNELGVHLNCMVRITMWQFTTVVLPKIEEWRLVISIVE